MFGFFLTPGRFFLIGIITFVAIFIVVNRIYNKFNE